MEEHVINLKQVRKARFNNKGFTLIEILIVVMVLGILAMVIVPQITVSTQDAKESTLQTDLTALRNAIELYAVQHDGKYPGEVDEADGTTVFADAAIPTDSDEALIAQLTQFSNVGGKTSATKDAAYPFGPYLKGGVFPSNPFGGSSAVVCAASADVTITTTTAAGGWIYYPKTGKILANHE